MSEYYQVPGREVLKKLNGSEEPLTSQQVREHQEKYGRNGGREEGDDSSHFSGTV